MIKKKGSTNEYMNDVVVKGEIDVATRKGPIGAQVLAMYVVGETLPVYAKFISKSDCVLDLFHSPGHVDMLEVKPSTRSDIA